MLRFMGIDEPEQVRCRIYGAEPSDHEREQEARRLALLRRMASPEGAIDGEAIDDAVAAGAELVCGGPVEVPGSPGSHISTPARCWARPAGISC